MHPPPRNSEVRSRAWTRRASWNAGSLPTVPAEISANASASSEAVQELGRHRCCRRGGAQREGLCASRLRTIRASLARTRARDPRAPRHAVLRGAHLLAPLREPGGSHLLPSPQKNAPLGGHFSVAEREGFEPPLGCPKPDFESGAFDHSAISPWGGHYTAASNPAIAASPRARMR